MEHNYFDIQITTMLRRNRFFIYNNNICNKNRPNCNNLLLNPILLP